MFQIVTAAKRLFTRLGATYSGNTQLRQSEEARDDEGTAIMVTSTRRTRFSPPQEDESSALKNGSGKRKKTPSPAPDVMDTQVPKKRMRTSDGFKLANGAEDSAINGVSHISGSGDTTSSILETAESKSQSLSLEEPANNTNPEEKATHVRFGSEELLPNINTDAELAGENGEKGESLVQEESDGDEAPETLHNVVQLKRLKAASRKEDEARQRFHSLHPSL
jgi:hypothetical protein